LTKFFPAFRTPKHAASLIHASGPNPKALQDFKLVMALRNKHIVHDENSHYQATALAWLEPDGQIDVREVA
jgi:hypothetical protein